MGISDTTRADRNVKIDFIPRNRTCARSNTAPWAIIIHVGRYQLILEIESILIELPQRNMVDAMEIVREVLVSSHGL